MMRIHAIPTRVLTAALVTGSMLVAAPAIGSPPAWAATSKNLIKNGTAERGPGGDGNTAVTVPNWTRSEGQSFTVITYGLGGGLQTDSPGPRSPGVQYFAGGPDDSSNTNIAEQTESLRPYAAAIAGGAVHFTLQAYLGGFSSQDDNASVVIGFRDKHGTVLASTTIGPVMAIDRTDITELVKRHALGTVPAGAKTVLVQLIMVRTAGTYNDGYADNLSLTLTGI
jgi:hypothetical protein